MPTAVPILTAALVPALALVALFVPQGKRGLR